jgi:hypothetical protein
MKIYPNELVWNEKLSKIPKARHEKEFAAMDRLFYQQGFKVSSSGNDKHGHYVEVDIKPGTTLQAVNQMLEDYSASAVTVRPEDFEPLYGKNIMTLGMRRKIEFDGDYSVSMLEPSELVGALDSLRVSSQFGGVSSQFGAEVSGDMEQFIVDDLQNEGYISQKEVDAMDRWLNPTPEPMGLQGLGRRDGIADAFEVGSDGENWAPDTSVDEWRDQ